jgi:hypothetical protein
MAALTSRRRARRHELVSSSDEVSEAMPDRDEFVLHRPIASADDVDALAPADRSLLAGWLAQSTQCHDILVSRARRRVGLAMTVGGVVLLVPWIVELATTLPDHHSSHQWRLAWTGFDVALALAFAFAGFAGWRRRQIAISALTVLGVLLLCDAWFDVTLTWGTSEHTASILAAAFAEIPVAILAFWLAYRLLRETVHYVWHLEGREHPVPPLRRIPIIIVPTRHAQIAHRPGFDDR